ncbi:MAG: hemolysin family protein [Rhodovarius sp.]|nr:hemolysin family protein [Rhodovarius sp.]MDW8314855.1 hemolysin family protein [Rhodovarius sp.]
MNDAPARPARLWLERLARRLRRRPPETVRGRMEELIEGAPGKGTAAAPPELSAHERLLLANVLALRDRTAADVMIPRADIVALPAHLSLEETIAAVQREGHSRYPVYQGQLDDILGMVHIRDIFARIGRPGPFSLKEILRKPLLVVPSVPVLDLLLRMREQRTHMALVVDEYGGIDGLVTIEDLVETIVGDIADEHDEVQGPQLIERPDGTVEIDARLPIAAFEARFGPVLTEEERAAHIDTVGGLVFTLAGRVPAKGELISHPSSGLEFLVLEADARRIRRLRLRRPGTPAARAAAE